VLDLGERIEGDVLNLIPPQRAASIARDAGLITANKPLVRGSTGSPPNQSRCQTSTSSVDATLAAPAMPQVGPHGQPARQDRGGCNRRVDERPEPRSLR